MTLLEVVVAVLILGLVSSAVASVMAYTLGQQQYHSMRLSAYEVANRLMIQYLDNDATLKSIHGRPIEYNGRRFEWECAIEKVTMDTPHAEGRSAGQYNSRFELVTVDVWPESYPTTTPASLTRLVDPAFLARNPASMAQFVQDPAHVVDYSLNRLGIGMNGSTSTSSSTIRYSGRRTP